ncbi:MAG: fatty acid desaturase [Acidobacteriota bacterium]
MFKYKEDRIPILLFVVYFGVDLLVFFTAESLEFVIFWMVLGIIPKAFISSWNHHHQHLETFHYPLCNRLLEIIYGFQTGIVSHGWTLHHVLGHHVNYLDQKKDESRWKRDDGQTMGEIEYAFTVAATGYPRAFQVGRNFSRPQRIFLLMGGITSSLLVLFFYINWVNALFVFVLPMMISLFITAWHTYSHHAGLDSQESLEASYNVTDGWHNLLTGNLGYHTAHHLRPALHWSKLPQFHDTIKAEIPQQLFRRPPRPICWITPLLALAKR